MKRIAAPSHWCLDKLGGIYAPRPSCGPHRIRECIPLILLLRNRLKYALTYNEAKMISMQRCVKIDSKVRTDTHFPCGFQGKLIRFVFPFFKNKTFAYRCYKH
jgi:small subunit ribosomal protein S4e